MGWKGTVRSVGAAMRAAERDAIRRQRDLDKQTKLYDKMLELEQAAHEVNVYENYIEVIQSIHKEVSVPIDWTSIARSKKPQEPQVRYSNEKEARLKLEKYSPNFIDRLFKKSAKNRITIS